jgi:hypothetical protein
MRTYRYPAKDAASAFGSVYCLDTLDRSISNHKLLTTKNVNNIRAQIKQPVKPETRGKSTSVPSENGPTREVTGHLVEANRVPRTTV